MPTKRQERFTKAVAQAAGTIKPVKRRGAAHAWQPDVRGALKGSVGHAWRKAVPRHQQKWQVQGSEMSERQAPVAKQTGTDEPAAPTPRALPGIFIDDDATVTIYMNSKEHTKALIGAKGLESVTALTH